jgi:hypothetical protein
MSKLSFQYGLSVFLMTPVVFVCSPLMVATAKGSGNPVKQQSQRWLDSATPTTAGTGRYELDDRYGLDGGRRQLTKDISLVEPVGGDDCVPVSIQRRTAAQAATAAALTRHAQVGLRREVGHGVFRALGGGQGTTSRQHLTARRPTTKVLEAVLVESLLSLSRPVWCLGLHVPLGEGLDDDDDDDDAAAAADTAARMLLRRLWASGK